MVSYFGEHTEVDVACGTWCTLTVCEDGVYRKVPRQYLDVQFTHTRWKGSKKVVPTWMVPSSGNKGYRLGAYPAGPIGHFTTNLSSAASGPLQSLCKKQGPEV